MSEFEPMMVDMILPAAFSSRMRTLLGNEYEAFDAALHTAPQVSLRLNPSKGIPSPAYTPVPWCREGYYLDTRPAFTFDPLLHAGAYYVQEASSMFLDFLLRRLIDRPVRYLDLCAAPGGKSTLALSALPAGSLLICNEVVRTRTSILAENLMKWGGDNLIVTRNSAADFGALRHYFDVILVDAPCSGEGMFRKEEQAVTEWSPNQIACCTERQREILSDVWEALSPGGLLLYSTCTYNREENEEIGSFLARRFQAEPLWIETPSEWHISPSFDTALPAYRFFPHRTRGEGLFMMALRKPGNLEEREIGWLGRNDTARSKG
ncbi:MAG: RsmB/NOP family class I SAM-dependent RNA methyltransferase, partial [Porphyromonadaceae bacterium]|nr:RsmB/NOP family class I SAM-dependent RNA methyltransferase [Porphyromonadaceae bacterium]